MTFVYFFHSSAVLLILVYILIVFLSQSIWLCCVEVTFTFILSFWGLHLQSAKHLLLCGYGAYWMFWWRPHMCCNIALLLNSRFLSAVFFFNHTCRNILTSNTSLPRSVTYLQNWCSGNLFSEGFGSHSLVSTATLLHLEPFSNTLHITFNARLSCFLTYFTGLPYAIISSIERTRSSNDQRIDMGFPFCTLQSLFILKL